MSALPERNVMTVSSRGKTPNLARILRRVDGFTRVIVLAYVHEHIDAPGS